MHAPTTGRARLDLAPMTSGPRITEMFAFVAVDPDTDIEGVCAFRSWRHGWVPMVGADPARVDQLRPQAQEIARATGQPVTVLRFTVRETVETIEP